MCPHWKSAVVYELRTVIYARDKCAFACVCVGVVSTDPLAGQVLLPSCRRGVSFFPLFHPNQRFRPRQDWVLLVLDPQLLPDQVSVDDFLLFGQVVLVLTPPVGFEHFQSTLALLLAPGLRTLISLFTSTNLYLYQQRSIQFCCAKHILVILKIYHAKINSHILW